VSRTVGRHQSPHKAHLWMQDVLVLRPSGLFARSPDAVKGPTTCPDPASVLEAASECRFREGLASEGMLCSKPPIPLRVLDFLPHTEDLLNLALVCKATHQAGHVLLKREVRCPMFVGGTACRPYARQGGVTTGGWPTTLYQTGLWSDMTRQHDTRGVYVQNRCHFSGKKARAWLSGDAWRELFRVFWFVVAQLHEVGQ
jgi:hypothetical protein